MAHQPSPPSAAPRSQARLSGPRSMFRGKLRGGKTLSLTLTPAGHEALAVGQARTGLSRPDYIEMLVRRAADQTASPS